MVKHSLFAATIAALTVFAAFGDASTTLTASRATDGTGGAVLVWDGDETAVYRGYSATGPWTEIGTVSAGVTEYIDDTGYYGIPTYYKVGDQVVSYTRTRRLGQNEADASLLEGVTILKEGTDYWSGGGNTGDKCFDGDAGTCCDVGDPANPRIGLAFGRACHIAYVRLITRANNEYGAGRVDRSVVFASSVDWESYNATAISEPLNYGDWYAALEWKTIVCNSSKSYTLAYLRRNDGNNTNGNYSELEFYGWYASDVEGLADPIQSISVECATNKAISVSWICPGSPDSFVVDRKTGDGEWTTFATFTGLDAEYADRAFVDTSVDYYGVYSYRVTARYESVGVSEVSDAASMECLEPVNLAVGYSDLSSDYYAVLSWTACDSFPDGTDVYRSDDSGATWSKITTEASGTYSYTDTTARSYGVLYLYRITPRDDATKLSGIVKYYRVHRLERDGNGNLVSGCSYRCSYGDGNGSPLFDGNIYSYADLYDWGSPFIGIDFGQESYAHVAFVRLYPRAGQELRLVGLNAYGSQASSEPWNSTVKIGGPLPETVNVYTWCNLECDPSTGYRAVILHCGGWCGNAGEAEFYGYTQTDLDDQAGFITGSAVSFADGAATVTWVCSGEPLNYVIERKTGDGEWTTIETVTSAEAAYSSHSFADANIVYGNTYSYRVTATYPSSSSVSEVCSVTSLEPGFSIANYDEYVTAYPQLLWPAAGVFASGATVQKKTGDGEWENYVSLAPGTGSYIDEDVKFGGTAYQYRIKATGGSAITDAIAYVRLRHLERKAAGTMDDGVSILRYPSNTWVYNDVGYVFDGNVNTYGDFGGDMDSNPRVGVDFGEGSRKHVARVRIYPRYDYGLPPGEDRQTGGRVYGVANGGDWAHDNAVQLSLSYVQNVETTAKWYELECNPSVAYRYVFVYNPVNSSCGDFGEIEFWGWTDRDVHGAFMLIIR